MLFYILASLAAIAILIAVPVLTARALLLMTRLEATRRDMAELIAEALLSLQHVNRLTARTQESVDRLHHALERMERILALLQPAAAVGSVLAGARKVLTGRRGTEPPKPSNSEGEPS